MRLHHDRPHDAESRSVVLFCLRAESDVDHVVPVIDALAEQGRHAIRVIVYDPIKTYRDDYRIHYLQQRHGLAVEHLLELPGLGLWRRMAAALLRRVFHCLLALQRRLHLHIAQGLLRVALMKLQRGLRSLGEGRFAVAALVAELEKIAHGAVAFDHTLSPMAKAVTAAARRRGLATIALPHSIPHLRDLASDPAFAGKDGTAWSELYDRVVLPNRPTALRFAAGGPASDRQAVLGSPRFCREWGHTLDRIAPRFDWQPGGTKVLFILSKKGPYVDWVAVDRVSEALCRDPRLAVVFKPHPRTEISGLPTIEASRRVTVAAPEIPTVSLIQWADLVVFWGSSVIYDALRQHKPALHLAYLFRLHFDFEDYLPSWRVDSFDHFTQRMEDFLTSGGRTYDDAEARACVSALIEPESAPVLQRYVDFFDALLETKDALPAANDRVIAHHSL